MDMEMNENLGRLTISAGKKVTVFNLNDFAVIKEVRTRRVDGRGLDEYTQSNFQCREVGRIKLIIAPRVRMSRQISRVYSSTCPMVFTSRRKEDAACHLAVKSS